MIIIPLQYEKHSGPDAIGDHKFTFSMNESVNLGESFKDLISTKKGKEFIVILLDNSQGQEADEFRNETPEETLKRFQKHLHVVITDRAKILQISPEQLKQELKDELKKQNIIKESSTELDLKGYAIAINIVKQL